MKRLVVLALLCLVSLSSADITFDPIEPLYSPGPVSFGFTVTNPTDSEVSIEVSAISYPEGKPSYLDAPPVYWTIELEPGASEHLSLDFTLSEVADSGTHILDVQTIGDYSDFAETEFTVVRTLKTFNMNLVACIDPCESYTTAFLLAESPIRIQALNSENSFLEGKVTTPSGAIEDISFFQDTAMLPLLEVGDYVLRVTATKTGYATDERTLEISVLEELPEVIEDKPCNTNGICDPTENPADCPEECADELDGIGGEVKNGQAVVIEQPSEGAAAGIDWMLVLIVIVLIIIVAVVLSSRRR